MRYFVGMLHRINRTHYVVAVQDANGVTAPTMYIEKDKVHRIENPEKQRKAVIAYARETSGLGRFYQWSFQ